MTDNNLKDDRWNQSPERCTEHDLSLQPGEFTCIACETNVKNYSVRKYGESSLPAGRNMEQDRAIRMQERRLRLKSRRSTKNKNQIIIDAIEDPTEREAAQVVEDARIKEENQWY